jgi:Ca2+-binding EF-hand superfamily protein
VCSSPIFAGTAELQAIFEKIDKDGSNGLDQFEITAALEGAGVKDASSWDVTKMFLEADHNRFSTFCTLLSTCEEENTIGTQITCEKGGVAFNDCV